MRKLRQPRKILADCFLCIFLCILLHTCWPGDSSASDMNSTSRHHMVPQATTVAVRGQPLLHPLQLPWLYLTKLHIPQNMPAWFAVFLACAYAFDGFLL